MGRIRIDESGWPLIVVGWPEGAVDDDSLDEFLLASERQVARREKQILLHDVVHAAGLDWRQRRRVADYARRMEPELARYVVAAAIASPSVLVRGMISTINWLTPPVYPQRVFAAPLEGEAWLWSEYEARVGARPARKIA